MEPIFENELVITNSPTNAQTISKISLEDQLQVKVTTNKQLMNQIGKLEDKVERLQM